MSHTSSIHAEPTFGLVLARLDLPESLRTPSRYTMRQLLRGLARSSRHGTWIAPDVASLTHYTPTLTPQSTATV